MLFFSRGIEATFIVTKSGMLRLYWHDNDTSIFYQQTRRQIFQ